MFCTFTLVLLEIRVLPNMAVCCSSLILCFPGMLLRNFLNDFEMVPVAPTVTGITFVFTVHLLLWLLLLLLWFVLSSPVTGLFFLVLLLNKRWSPPLTLQVSHCSTFRTMCDVPSIAVFCSESIECFLGISSTFFLKLLVTIPVVLIITGIIVHFRFHIRYLYT